MNNFRILLVVLAINQMASAAEALKQIYSGSLPTKQKDQIKLEVPKDWTDPGIFTQLTIKRAGKVALELKELQATDLKNVNHFPAEAKDLEGYLKFFPTGNKNKKSEFLLALSNFAGGSSDDELILISLSKAGIKKIFQQSIQIAVIKDFDGDGYYDLLKIGGRGEPQTDNRFSYDPYLVYRQVHEGDEIKFVMNEMLSQKWTMQNKFQWQGPKYDANIPVDKNGELAPKK